MALELNYTKQDGSSGNYWRINTFNWDNVNSSVYITLGLYKDQNFRQNNINYPLLTAPIVLTNVNVNRNLKVNELITYFYNLIKEKKIVNVNGKFIDFTEAIVILET